MPRMSDQLKIELDGSALETGAKRVESALNELRTAIAALSSSPIDKIKADLGKVGTAMAEVTRAVGNDLKGMRDEARKAVKATGDAMVEETDKATSRVIAAQRTGYLRMRDLRIKSQAQAVRDDQQFYSQVRQLRVQAQAQAVKDAAEAEAARFAGVMGSLKNASKSMWAQQLAKEAAEIKAEQARFTGVLTSVKNASRSMWDERARAEEAGAAAFKQRLTVIHNQVKSMWAQQAAEIKAQRSAAESAMASAGRTSSALFNQAAANPSGSYSSIVPGKSYGTTAYDAEAEAAKRAQAELKKYQSTLGNVAGGKARASKESAGLTQAFLNQRDAANNLHSAYRGLASGFGALWLTWGAALPLLTGALISGAIVQSVKQGAQVGEVLGNIQYLGEVSVRDMGKLEAKLMELGRKGTKGPLEVAQAFEALALAGLSADEQIKAIKPTLDFSVAGGVGLKESAETLVSVATAFGYSAQYYSVVSDVITKTAATSLASVSDMNAAFQQASAIAQQYRVSLTDVATGLALLSNVGIKGSAAGTSIRNMFTELLGSSKEARRVINDYLQLDIFDGNKLKPVREIMGDIVGKLGKLDFKSQLNVLAAMGNERGTKALSAFLDAAVRKAQDGTKSLSEMRSELDRVAQEIEDAPGFSAITAIGKSNTSAAQFEGLKASLQTALVEAFRTVDTEVVAMSMRIREALNSPEFSKTITSMVSGALSLVQFLYEYRGAIETVAKAWGVYAAASTAAFAIDKAATVVGAVWNGLLLVRTALVSALSAATATYNATMVSMAIATTASSAAMTAAAASAGVLAFSLNLVKVALGPISIALAAAAAAYYLFADSAEDNKDSLEASASAAATLNKSTNQRLDDEISRLKTIIQERTKGADSARAEAKAAEDAALRNLAIVQATEIAELNVARAKAEQEGSVDRVAAINRSMLNATVRHAAQVEDLQGKYRLLADLSKQVAKFAEADRPKTQAGTGTFSRDQLSASNRAKSYATAYSTELSEIEKRYRARMSLLEKLESNEQSRIGALQSAGAIREGEFMAREIQAAVARERGQLETIEANTEAYKAAYERRYQARIDAFNRDYARNAGKEGFAEWEDSEVTKMVQDLTNLEEARRTAMEGFAADRDKVGDSAFTRLSKQAAATAGAIQKTRDAADEFWRAEDRAQAKMARQTSVEDALRYASPRSAAYIAAAAAETDRLTDRVEDYDETLRQMTESLESYVAAVGDDANWTEELTAKYWDLQKALGAVRAERDRVSERIPGMSDTAGQRAILKFQKDEEARLISGVADAIATGLFEGGQAGKKKLRDLIVAELRKPITLMIQAVVQAGIGEIFGVPGGQGAMGAASSLLGSASNLSSAYNMASNAYTWLGLGSASTAATGLGLSASVGTGTSIYAAGTGGLGLTASSSGLGLTASGTTLTGSLGTSSAVTGGASAAASSGGLSGAMSAIPAWGWAAMAAVAILSSMDDSGTIHAGGAAQYNSALGETRTSTEAGAFGLGFGSVDSNDNTISNVSSLAKSLADGLSSTAEAFGKTAGFEVATAFADDTSKDGAWGALRISRGGEDLVNWQDTQTSRWAPKEFSSGKAGVKEYDAELAKSTLQVLRDMDLPSWATEMLDSLGDAPTMETLGNTVGYINGVQAALTEMGKAMPQLAGITGETVTSLIQLFGGIEALNSSLGSYYQEFYTQAERSAVVSGKVGEALAELGLAMPDTREGFRDLVEAQDVTTAAGRETYTALIKLAPAFASVTEASRDAADIASERAGLERQLLQAQGNTNALRQLELATLDASNRALQMQIWAIEDAEKAAQNASQAAQEARAELETMWNEAFDALSRAVEAQRDLAQEQLDSLREVYDLARTNANELFGFAGDAGMSVAQAMEFISNSAANAQATGYMPDADMLEEAIKVMRGQIDPKNYTSQAAYDLDRLRTANNLQQIADAAEPQMTALEQQLAYLEETLETAKSQLDALLGVNSSVLSVAAALAAWESARSTKSAGSGSAGSGLVTIGPGSNSTAPRDESAKILTEINRYDWSEEGKDDAAAALRATAYWLGWTQEDIAAATGYNLADIQAVFDSAGIPPFANGGLHSGGARLVGEFGPEVEVTGPAMYYSAAKTKSMLSGGGDEDSDYLISQLLDENRAMRSTMQQMEARLASIARNAERTSQTLDDAARNKRPLYTATP